MGGAARSGLQYRRRFEEPSEDGEKDVPTSPLRDTEPHEVENRASDGVARCV
jgi:hypothetical protein